MRGLAACLVGILGLGALATMATTMSACSDTSDAGSGGAGGSTAAAGSGGKVSAAGGSSKAGSGGGSADECGFQTPACSACLGDKCEAEATACSDIDDCATALYTLANACVCDPAKDPATCISDFVSENGDPAKDLATCFNTNCADVCN